jgi:hypothetical protein
VGISPHERLVAEVGQSRLSDIHQAIIQLIPCARCGASICAPCVTVDGKSPGTPTANHIARLKRARLLYELWYRMAGEDLGRRDERDEGNECLKTLGVV